MKHDAWRHTSWIKKSSTKIIYFPHGDFDKTKSKDGHKL